MNTARFAQSPAGRVVQSVYDGRPYWAFVPHPLPPVLLFDTPLLLQLSEADRALGELSGLGRTIPNPQLLIGPFLRQEAVLSSKIEGTQTGIADLYAYEAGQLVLPGLTPPRLGTVATAAAVPQRLFLSAIGENSIICCWLSVSGVSGMSGWCSFYAAWLNRRGRR